MYGAITNPCAAADAVTVHNAGLNPIYNLLEPCQISKFNSWMPQDLVHQLVPHSKLLVFPGAGHGLQFQEPQKLAEAIIRFLA